MFVETAKAVGTTIELGQTIYEHRTVFTKSLRKLRSYWRHGHVRIAVFGVGGTGKTTLGELLSGKSSLGAKPSTYQLSHKTEAVTPDSDFVSTLYIPGGQERYILNDWPALYQNLAQGKSRGIINIVCYGHHSFTELNYKATKYFLDLPESVRNTISKEDFVKLYLESKRARELEIMREMLPHLKTAKERIWMLTVVTKQDLWWKERATVQAFYEGGEYNSYINEIATNRGQQNFAHAYVSASLVINNLQTNDADILVPTAEGYDQNLQYANLFKLVDTIHAFMGR